jgi:hypothetical protein
VYGELKSAGPAIDSYPLPQRVNRGDVQPGCTDSEHPTTDVRNDVWNIRGISGSHESLSADGS